VAVRDGEGNCSAVVCQSGLRPSQAFTETRHVHVDFEKSLVELAKRASNHISSGFSIRIVIYAIPQCDHKIALHIPEWRSI